MKYFYTDPLKASWMRQEHGVAFNLTLDNNPFNPIKWQTYYHEAVFIESGTNLRFYIRPDFHEMLKPINGDFGADDDCMFVYKESPGLDNLNGWWEGEMKVDDEDSSCIEIIRRNGKTFFMPEIEE